MDILEEIKSKTSIDIDRMMKRLELELKTKKCMRTETDECIRTEKDECIEFEGADVQELMQYCIYDTMLIILDVTHLRRIDESLYSIWVAMAKDYWFLNKYDVLILSKEERQKREEMKVKSIAIGDTTTTFADTSSQVEINGIMYNTGTIDFSKNFLLEKYKKDLNRHRRLRW